MQGRMWLIVIVVGLYALHRLALWMESRGWIYYMKSGGHSTRAGSAMLEIQQLLEPSKRHVIEIRQEQREEEDSAGDPPDADPGGDAQRGAEK
ncbi:MAG TPA: hypothetical protein PLZ95_01800 [Bryobacteraceae bacterium]|nr:hypothetical protein [Bryobacteraceae bacterium]